MARTLQDVQEEYDGIVVKINDYNNEIQTLKQFIPPLKDRRDKLHDTILLMKSPNMQLAAQMTQNAAEVLAEE